MPLVQYEEDFEGEYMNFLDKVVKKEITIDLSELNRVLKDLNERSVYHYRPWGEYADDIKAAYSDELQVT